MDTAHIVLLLLVAALASALLWLAFGRGSLQAQAAAASADAAAAREQLESERARQRTELDHLRAAALAEERELEASITALRDELSRIGQELAQEREGREGDKRLHARDVATAAEQLKAAREQFEQLREQSNKDVAARDAALQERFKALAADALKDSREAFLAEAKSKLEAERTKATSEMDSRKVAIEALLKPVSETLTRTDAQLTKMTQEWAADRAKLETQMLGVKESGEGLRAETLKLARALSKPEVRGRYGEIQLRRVAELAGMSAYCDFAEQDSTRNADGKVLRPDMIVRLPNQRVVAVDAKANVAAYLEAIDAATPEAREICLDRFARHMEEQVTKLSDKKYWEHLDGSPDFVVMFVPGDQFLDAALARKGDLLDHAAQQNVILASPSTLIGLLRAVAVGWREKRLSEQAGELFALAKEVHDRAAVAYEKVSKLGKALESAVDHYNGFVGSYESRLEPSLRKLEDAGVKSSRDLPNPPLVTVKTRTIALEQPALPGT
ncbi:MAG: DNA recombination protein RmuC [Phycisphaerales bacterium]|jgi:DNA recombination protein RmuC